jgi:hypothetical protein
MDDFTVSKPRTSPAFSQLRITRSKSDPDTKVIDETNLRKRKETIIVDGENYPRWHDGGKIRFCNSRERVTGKVLQFAACY